MKNTCLISFLLFAVCVVVEAQDKFYTKAGRIFFECGKSPAEKIEAVNKSGTCVLDTKTGSLQMSVLMSGFEFQRALMQEHFNENRMPSLVGEKISNTVNVSVSCTLEQFKN